MSTRQGATYETKEKLFFANLHLLSFCDFLLGFGRWDAARAQLGTASVGLAGALTALGANGTEGMADGRFTSWILPFTAGGFLHIALVTGIDAPFPFGSEGNRPRHFHFV